MQNILQLFLGIKKNGGGGCWFCFFVLFLFFVFVFWFFILFFVFCCFVGVFFGGGRLLGGVVVLGGWGWGLNYTRKNCISFFFQACIINKTLSYLTIVFLENKF